MFKLNKDHKKALLSDLKKFQDEKELNQKCMDKEKGNLVHWFEITDYLLGEKIKIIMNALIEGEIDY